MGSPSILTNPMFNMGFLLVSMQLAKKVDWNDPNVVTYARMGYYGAQVLVVIMAYGLITLIKKKNDTTVLTYNAPQRPSMSGDSSAPQTITTTVRDYDVEQVKQFIQSTLTSIVIISVMHFQFKFTQPLLMQSIMPIKNLLTHKESLIHLWGDAPEGNLARPFVAENPLGALTNMFGGGNNNAAAPAANTTTASTNNEHSHQE
ncbi:inorganic phosphate transporter Pho88 [Cokeromyces recurvatus]|uniref:inorganic phosphate transporter Pho88 n=1 Tax=Cokeromyces recurvatus TaxID=90255 RepID=UPI00221FB032|nr:inorganic phosphate transporter Pho88 [Cokeromyces recurvatus]KAI7901378.1 inorganic phosphate transporter Pho88 [Cokeromyces recurvatus]